MIDGKYIDFDFLRHLALRGSDPARFAFLNNKILFSRIDSLEDWLLDIAKYPISVPYLFVNPETHIVQQQNYFSLE